MSEGTVVTFYSYKGGVGRTLALANVAALLSLWGYRVLCVDWDLEAPGLHLYFKPWTVGEEAPGLVDLIHAEVENGRTDKPPPAWQEYISTVEVPGALAPISLITAGKRDASYLHRMQALDWPVLFRDHAMGHILERLRDQWKSHFDFIFIDSRTGVTDIGGICTVQMPDMLVLLFTANQQSLDGVLDVALRASERRYELPVDRAGLLTLPVVTRFDGRVEFKSAQTWMKTFAERLPPLYESWLHKDVGPAEIINHTRVPYVPHWSFGESLPVIEEGTQAPDSIGFVLETIAALVALRLADTDLLARNRDSFVAAARMAAAPGSAGHYVHDVFVSHAAIDRRFAEALARGLKGRGFSVFIEGWATSAKARAGDQADRALQRSRHLVPVIGREFRPSQQYEAQSFLKLLIAEPTAARRVVTVLTKEGNPEELPLLLRPFYVVEAGERPPEEVARDVESALNAESPLKAAAGGQSPASAATSGAGRPVERRQIYNLQMALIGVTAALIAAGAWLLTDYSLTKAMRHCESQIAHAATAAPDLAPCEKACSSGSAKHCSLLGDAALAASPGEPRATKRAVEAYRKACDGGDASGCGKLGALYERGAGIEKDDKAAAELYQKGCGLRDTHACAGLGFFLEYGKGGLAVDKRGAASHYKLACDADDPRGCAGLASLYISGEGGLPKDEALGARLYQRACDGGDMGACAGLGPYYQSGTGGFAKDEAKAVSLYTKACESGEMRGCANLAAMYRSGSGGLPKDEPRAMGLFQQACDADYVEGCNALGQWYEQGRGAMARDMARAASLYKRSCDEGVFEGCYNLGNMYLEGKGGLPKDVARAAELYRLPCEKGAMEACGALGRMYRYGIGTPKDMALAVSNFEKACDSGILSACSDLGSIYAAGEQGVRVDEPRALELYRKACAGDEMTGCTNLGLLYARGAAGEKPDEERAVELYRKACDGGQMRGCYELGLAYEMGRGGFAVNEARAQDLFRRACEGEPLACLKLTERAYDANTKLVERIKRAAEFYEKQCLGGDSEACIAGAQMYASALGRLDKDGKREELLYRKSCDLNNAIGCFNLGTLYVEGGDGADRSDEGVELLSKACAQKYQNGCDSLRALVVQPSVEKAARPAMESAPVMSSKPPQKKPR